jgi:hypothetical protein
MRVAWAGVVVDGLKTCRRCEVAKPVEEFRGQRRACRLCERIEKNAARTQLDRAPVVGVLKVCSKCEEEKPCEEFSTDKRARDGRHAWCNPCARTKAGIRYADNPAGQRTASRKYKAKNPEKTKNDFRRYDLSRRFGLTPEEYDEWRAGVERCAICGTTEPGVRGWALDHCHRTDKLRNFLCTACNLGLGVFGDDPDRLMAAAAYLIKYANLHKESIPENTEE